MKKEPIIWYVILIHLIWGISLILYREEIRTTSLSPFYNYLSPLGIGILFVIIALLASYAVFEDEKYPKISHMLLIPQQLLVLMSGVVAIQLSIQGHYADGVIRPSMFIFNDQLPFILLTIFYTASLIHSLRNGWH